MLPGVGTGVRRGDRLRVKFRPRVKVRVRV
jgi:hypothetical protein